MTAYGPVLSIDPAHDTSSFDCGSVAESDWLKYWGLKATFRDTAQTYVILEAGTNRVAGFYALAAGSVETGDAPQRVSEGAGRYGIPVALLARLGVDLRDQGKGLGADLVADAMRRAVKIAGEMGVRALMVDAETPEAKNFYLGLAEFLESPHNPLTLFLPIQDIRAQIGPDVPEDVE